jgi:hypothetical protein
MSKMIIKGHDAARFELNVTQFRSTMSASINSVQTRRMAHHFPIRAGQPDIQFTVQFPSIADKHKFQDFVRSHQLNTLDDRYSSTEVSGGKITLIWPERNIDSWTGYIVTMPVREARFDYAPRVTFGVALVDSLMSERTFNFSLGNSWTSIIGQVIGAYIPDPTSAEAAFQLPTPPAADRDTVDTATTTGQSFLSRIVGRR